MFDHVAGLTPEQAALWTAMVEQSRPVLAAEGMEAVQALLLEHGMSVIQAIVITRALLGWDETSLRDATDIVAGSATRATDAPAASGRVPALVVRSASAGDRRL